MANDTGLRLVADVGGTHSRLAMYDPASDALRCRHDYRNADFNGMAAVIARWLEEIDEPRPAYCCIAIAAPPFDDQVEMLNLNWSFSINSLRETFGFTALRCINDFEGNAYALPHLSAQDLETLHIGKVGNSGKLAAVGPGTGLGGATFGLVNGNPVANACEPGHMSLAAATPLEQAIFAQLLKERPDVFAELLLSGPGIKVLYDSLAQVMGQSPESLSAEEISQRAADKTCGLCVETMETFCALLGSLCGDYVLAQGAYGGLYLCGGILPRMLPLLTQSTFHQRFVTKGNMTERLRDVPIHLVVSGRAGLIGAAHTPI